MRILFLTNYYPPHEIGGQGRSCLEVCEGLQSRGHECIVLTSMHGIHNVPTIKDGIHRELFLEMDSRPIWHMFTFFTSRKKREAHSLAALERVAGEFQPDVIFIWGMWNLPVSLPKLAERLLPDRVAYRFAEYWPTLPSQHEMYWLAKPKNWLTFLPKKFLAIIALKQLAAEERVLDLKFAHVMCVSAGTRQVLLDAGIPIEHAKIIYTGLDLDLFTARAEKSDGFDSDELVLLYAGRMAAEKGVDTLIAAVASLLNRPAPAPVRLVIAGSTQSAYFELLNEKIRSLKMGSQVKFLNLVPSAEMPALMRSCDVLILPSIWPEPFARVVLEAMASGMVVIATPTGGTSEIVEDGRNGLLFPAGDVSALSEKILLLVGDRDACARLSQAGLQTVREHFTKKGMLDSIETFLRTASGNNEGSAG